VFGVGYNGSKKDALPRDFRFQGDHEKGKWVLHAEQNVFMFRSIEDIADCTLYSTHSPCLQCSGIIRETPVRKVFYLRSYRPPPDLDAGKLCHHFKVQPHTSSSLDTLKGVIEKIIGSDEEKKTDEDEEKSKDKGKERVVDDDDEQQDDEAEAASEEDASQDPLSTPRDEESKSSSRAGGKRGSPRTQDRGQGKKRKTASHNEDEEDASAKSDRKKTHSTKRKTVSRRLSELSDQQEGRSPVRPPADHRRHR
jgi:deoxycytidylate deaminase